MYYDNRTIQRIFSTKTSVQYCHIYTEIYTEPVTTCCCCELFC